VGPYAQDLAPAIYGQADILLHPQYNDCCPSVVLEALSCGLPVVYSATGGTPELVGAEGGIGVPGPFDWETVHPPDPAALAEAVLAVADRLPAYREAARQRAVDRFDLRPWIERHVQVFEELVEGSKF
jgi:glycosyltransferase involved in cell wall biosynthesis